MATDKAAQFEPRAAERDFGTAETFPAEALGDGFRILIYSHDSFGLGHLRRCRAIAHALVEHRSNLSVLILSGSPIIGSFDFRSRVDFVRVPGVIKLRNGEYTALNLHIGLQQTLAIRASIIRHTAEVFAPHLFLVDKEPLGLRGEIEETLAFLKERRTPLVLGLRDVIDEPELLLPEWERKNAVPRCRNITIPSGSTACRRFATPLPECASRNRCGAKWFIPDTCGGTSRPADRSIRFRPKIPIFWSRPAAAATARPWSTGCCASTNGAATCRCAPSS